MFLQHNTKFQAVFSILIESFSTYVQKKRECFLFLSMLSCIHTDMKKSAIWRIFLIYSSIVRLSAKVAVFPEVRLQISSYGLGASAGSAYGESYHV